MPLAFLPLNDYLASEANDPGDNSYEHTTAFIEQKFRAQSNNPAKQLYFHLTCATDTENVKFVFNAARSIILKTTLQNLSMYT